MRFYRIDIVDPAGVEATKTLTSYVNNVTMPGALNVELDIYEFDFATPMGACALKIWGISIQDIAQASDFRGRTINVYVGMQKGLPLAKPNQAGLVLSGTIFQAFGNWEATNMTLDFVVIPFNGVGVNAKNLVLNCKKGQSLTAAIQQALSTAYQGFTLTVKTSKTLTVTEDSMAYFSNLVQFAKAVQNLSQSIINDPNYAGLTIILRSNELVITDGSSTPASAQAINYEDLIGQPTWLDYATMQFKTVMRADLKVADYILMPEGQVTLGAKSFANFKDVTTFTTSKSKPFRIKRIRHVGNYRNPDPHAWVSIFDCLMT